MWSRQGRIQLTIVAIEARVRTGPAPPSVSWQAGCLGLSCNDEGNLQLGMTNMCTAGVKNGRSERKMRRGE